MGGSMEDKKIKNLTFVALFIALVVIGSKIEFRSGYGRIHLGNSMCLLAAFVLSPVYGGLAAGLGSMMFDILFYTSGPACLITFVTKFVLGYVAGLVFSKTNKYILAGIAGQLAYMILYAGKSYIDGYIAVGGEFNKILPIVIEKVSKSAVNAVIAVILAALIYEGIAEKLKKMKV